MEHWRIRAEFDALADFRNKSRALALELRIDSKNALIFDIFSYQAVYHDISAEHIVHTAEFNGGEEGSGKLEFSIVKHSDRHFDSPLDNDAVSIVGDTIFFTVEIETPIVGVEFAIAGINQSGSIRN